MTEAEELESDLRAVYGELLPHRDPATMRISDDVIALGVLLRREMRTAKPVPPANLRQRTMERLAGYNPKDPE